MRVDGGSTDLMVKLDHNQKERPRYLPAVANGGRGHAPGDVLGAQSFRHVQVWRLFARTTTYFEPIKKQILKKLPKILNLH
mgnify:CR=1 FL=1